VLLHVMILAALLRVTALAPPPAAEQEVSADRLQGAGQQLVRVDVVPAPTAAGRVCAGSSYVGIGVTIAPATHRIILVGDDTPASRAGLQHDDIVLNPWIWDRSHPEGTLLRIDLLRGGARRAVWLQVGKICIG
jgi:hypothetical protein